MSPYRSRKLRYAGAALAIAATVIAQTVTDAPAGFSTYTLSLDPGSQSVSNGIAEPPGDRYALDQSRFEMRHDLSNGLGPIYNATAWVDCHQNLVTGAAGQITEVRAGHTAANGAFIAASVPINGGNSTIANRSIVNDRATCEAAAEHLPDTETIRVLRATLSTLGDGLVEAIDDRFLLAVAAAQPTQSNGLIRGEAIRGRNRPGRPARYGQQAAHRAKSRFMHDLASPNLNDAIQQHAGEARQVTANFNALTPAQQQQVIMFLKSL